MITALLHWFHGLGWCNQGHFNDHEGRFEEHQGLSKVKSSLRLHSAVVSRMKNLEPPMVASSNMSFETPKNGKITFEEYLHEKYCQMKCGYGQRLEWLSQSRSRRLYNLPLVISKAPAMKLRKCTNASPQGGSW